VNVAKMLATRHQMLQSYLSSGPRFPSECTINSMPINANSLSNEAGIIIRSIVLTDATALCYSEVSIKGTTYKQGSLLPYEIQHWNKTAVFGAIDCVVAGRIEHFIVKMRRAVFNHQFGCYQIVESSGDAECVRCLTIDEFIDFYPLSVYQIQELQLVVLKHQFVDVN
jgi:hypothetical protein